MKKNDLKKVIKPLVKECINEILIEEGMLSNIVSEVAQGMRAPALVAETVSTAAAPRTPPPTNVDATETDGCNWCRCL